MSHPQVVQLSKPEVLNNSERLLALLLSLREEVSKIKDKDDTIGKSQVLHPQVEKGGLSPSELVSSLVKLIASNNAAVKGEVLPKNHWNHRLNYFPSRFAICSY